MTVYYVQYNISNEERLFSFDTTTEISLSDSGSATSYRLENGESVSDHYVNNNITVSFTGKISDIKSVSNSNNDKNTYSTTQQFLSELRALKHQAIPFKVYMGANFGSVDNCVFESLDIRQDVTTGTRVVGDQREVSAFRVSFTAKQIRFGRRATITAQPNPIIADTVAPERPKAGQTENKEDRVLVRLGNTIYTRQQYETMVRNSSGNLPDVNTLPVVEDR